VTCITCAPETICFPSHETTEAIRLVVPAGKTFEIRAGFNQGAWSGYYNDPDAAAKDVEDLLTGKVDGVYLLLNEIPDSFIGRGGLGLNKPATKDTEITRRRWLFIDVDPERARGISATGKEKGAAYDVLCLVSDYLETMGFSDPIRSDSGNGFHLKYPIDVPNTEESKTLIKSFLYALHRTFSNSKAKIDISVSNASRIAKLEGTLACKGEDLPERPHRMAKLLSYPQEIIVNPEERLQAVVTDLEEIQPVEPVHTTKKKDGSTSEARFALVRGACERHNYDKSEVWQVCKCDPLFRIIYSDTDRERKFETDFDKCSKTRGTGLHYTDAGNSERLIRKYGDIIRFSQPENSWYIFKGGVWSPDIENGLTIYANATVKDIVQEAEGVSDEKLQKRIVSWARQSESLGRRKALIEGARGLVPVIPSLWDADPNLFNLQNGTLELDNLKIREHRAPDMLTKLAGVTYDPDANCPMWEKHLKLIFGDKPGYIEDFRALCGYILTGNNPEQLFFVFYGSGKNGKSVTLNVLGYLFGDYSGHLSSDSLMVRRSEAPRSDLAVLKGLRLVTSGEGNEGRALDESWIKQITGGDPITVRKLYQNEITFEPVCKILYSTNHLPQIRGTDEAIWRRVYMVPFLQTIPEEIRDLEITEKLKGEGPGILNWCLEGLERIHSNDNRLPIPTAVKNAVENYRSESDTVRHFIRSRFVIGDTGQITKAELYDQYLVFCENEGDPAISKKAYSKRMLEIGLTEHRTKTQRYWQYIREMTDKEHKANESTYQGGLF